MYVCVCVCVCVCVFVFFFCFFLFYWKIMWFCFCVYLFFKCALLLYRLSYMHNLLFSSSSHPLMMFSFSRIFTHFHACALIKYMNQGRLGLMGLERAATLTLMRMTSLHPAKQKNRKHQRRAKNRPRIMIMIMTMTMMMMTMDMTWRVHFFQKVLIYM